MVEEAREQAIRERAYAIWEQHGRPDGRCLEHWSQAETEIGIGQEVPTMPKVKPKARPTGSAKRRRLSQ